MKYTSNAKLIITFKLVTNKGNFNAKYNSKDIYNNLEYSKSNNDDKIEGKKKVPELLIAFTSYTIIKSNLDSICIPCITNK